MSRSIIVEGPDGSGKSTLASSLSTFLRWPVFHTGGPIYDRDTFWKRAKSLNHGRAVYDRHPGISQIAYGFLDWDGITLEEGREALSFADPLAIVYCRLSDPQLMLAGMIRSKKDHKPAEYLEKVERDYSKILERYDSLFSVIPHLKFDYQSKQAEQVLFQTIFDLIQGAS